MRTINDNKKWLCRWATPHDQEALLKLFHSAFGHAMPTDLWGWKYALKDNYGVLAHADGNIIAYYGGIPRTFWLGNETIPAVQICDVMVAPEMRGILTRHGPFMHTANTFLAAQTGKDKAYQFAFGFPSNRHAKLGEKMKLYARVDTLLEASWHTNTRSHFHFWLKTKRLTQGDDLTVNRIWQTMRQSLANFLVPQKDAEFFKWRYLEHPHHAYHSFIVSWRWSRKIVGIVTLRDHGPDHGMELMDLLGCPSALGTLLKVAINFAGRMGSARVFSWLTPNVLSALPNPSTQSEITGIYIAAPDLQEISIHLKSRWWLMGGDTDFR